MKRLASSRWWDAEIQSPDYIISRQQAAVSTPSICIIPKPPPTDGQAHLAGGWCAVFVAWSEWYLVLPRLLCCWGACLPPPAVCWLETPQLMVRSPLPLDYASDHSGENWKYPDQSPERRQTTFIHEWNTLLWVEISWINVATLAFTGC